MFADDSAPLRGKFSNIPPRRAIASAAAPVEDRRLAVHFARYKQRLQVRKLGTLVRSHTRFFTIILSLSKNRTLQLNSECDYPAYIVIL
jgi:hypothetical protein